MHRTSTLIIAAIVVAGCGTGPGAPTASSGSSLIGKAAADISLKDSKGNDFALSGALGKSAIVLVFYRGDW